ADPVAPRPTPSMTVPSASTMSAVGFASLLGAVVVAMEKLRQLLEALESRAVSRHMGGEKRGLPRTDRKSPCFNLQGPCRSRTICDGSRAVNDRAGRIRKNFLARKQR